MTKRIIALLSAGAAFLAVAPAAAEPLFQKPAPPSSAIPTMLRIAGTLGASARSPARPPDASILWEAGWGRGSPPQDKASTPAQTILFIGNSFTYGAHSPVWKYRADSVTDLNHDGVGGVPALFKLFTEEAGLNYAVSLETSGGKTLKWHWRHKKDVVDRPWDHVVLQDLSVLIRDRPGDPTNLIDYAGRFARLFTARNPKADVRLTATWSRPDQTFPADGHWHGQPITAMALELRRDYDKAKASSPAIDGVNPVGQAFNCAILAGVADANPYDGIGFGTVDLWAYDHYHASRFGYYLEALTVFNEVTGKDPRAFGPHETAADELGISPTDAVRLQRVAWATTHDLPCADVVNRARGNGDDAATSGDARHAGAQPRP